ncbi:MAG: IS200/IS605 family transposase [Bacteroidales bacterium]|nr:IS200/IS605 family transposase [Bacteroidales bacterium]MCF8328337.1 IS200/IS605 family transposase [Bacteroidales bacterium]
MDNTYTQINIHAIFAPYKRENIILKEYRSELFKYIKGILNNNKQYSLAVNGCKGHVHIFFEIHPTTSLSDILRIVKTNSSKWINQNRFVKGKFEWQDGYGAFSYFYSQRDDVIKCIMNQEDHHKKRTFSEEYFDLLERFQIEFDDHYMFKFYD